MAKKEKKINKEKVFIKETSVSADVISLLNPLMEVKSGLSTTLKLLISALTLVSALAWNEALKAVFEYLKQYLPISTALVGPFIYAVIVTLITVFLINRLKMLQNKVGKEKEKKEK